MYTADNTAKYILNYCNDNKIVDCSNKKLQKLLYYVQAWSLAFTGSAIFNDDIEAWLHGPVVPAVYHAYKEFGFDPISETDTHSYTASYLLDNQIIVNYILSCYAMHDAEYLEMRTHMESPWLEARRTNKKIITTDSMKTYYKDSFEQNADDNLKEHIRNLVEKNAK